MLNFVICEDEVKQANNLETLVKQIVPDCTIQTFTSGEHLLQSLETIGENTIFLMDIMLKELSGIDIAKQINQQVRNAVVIFISAFIDKVSDVYDAVHCYFIYKPELEKRLPLAIKKAEMIINEYKKTIVLSLKGKQVQLNVADIKYFERVKRTTYIYEKSECYKSSLDLNYFKALLLGYFVQCHRSYIINLNEVKEYKRTEFLLNDGTIIPISRSFANEVHQKFQTYLLNRVKDNEQY